MEAESNLNKFLHAEKERLEHGRIAASTYFKQSHSLYQNSEKGVNDYRTSLNNKAYQLVSRALELSPDNKSGWALKGKLSLLLGFQKEARTAFLNAGANFQHHAEICQQFADADLSNVRQLMQMLSQLDDYRLVNDFIHKTTFAEIPLQEKVFFTREALKLRNPKLKTLHFAFDPEHLSLDLSGNKNLALIFMIKNLPLRQLNLSGTAINADFKHLQRLPLLHLDVSRTAFSDKHFQYIKGKNLKTIICPPAVTADLQRLFPKARITGRE